MASKELIYDVTQLDFNNVVADLEEIRRYNPQRFEMEQLSAIVVEDLERYICVAYKDVTENEFWIRGHMPGMPLMPGVVMCEVAAQVCSYFTMKYRLLGEDCQVVGFGGLEEVRFRGPVRIGDRLIVMCERIKVRIGALILCRWQGVVDGQVVVDGKMKGIPLPVDSLLGK